MSSSDGNMTPRVQATGRGRRSLAPVGLEVLGLLARNPEGLGISDLARAVDLEVAQAHRLVRDLVASGWLVQPVAGGSYVLTGSLLALAAEQLRHTDLRSVSVPVMRRLRQEIGETVVLAEFRIGGLFCIAREMPEAPVVAWTQVGERWPLGSPAAVALALEAAVVAAQQEELLPSSYALTPQRRAELDETATRGWSYDAAGYRAGGSAVGAAVRDHEGRPVGALAIGWPRDRSDDGLVEDLGQRVKAAAAEISANLGFRRSVLGEPWRAIMEEHEQDLFRHLADLRIRGYEGEVSRDGQIGNYRRACELLGPVVEDVLGHVSDRLLAGRGRIVYERIETPDSGLETRWALHWPEQEAALVRVTGAPLEPVTVVGRLRPAHIHGHLGGSYFGDWPMQITAPADARRQAPVVLSIVEAEIHQRVFEAGGNWRLIPAFCQRIGEPSLVGPVPQRGGET